jgi:mycofactocin precursor
MPYSVESIAVCRDTTTRKAVPMEPNDQNPNEQNDQELVIETLVEEVSIDGMCGVY